MYDNTVADSDAEHLDTVLVSLSSKITDRTAFIEKKISENPAEGILLALRKMESIGVTVAGIPCNTAHSDGIFDVVEQRLKESASSLKLLNMIHETADFITENYASVKKIGVLSTTGTYKSGVYTKNLRSRGYEVLFPDFDIQEKYVHAAIYDREYGIKSQSNPVHPQAVENLMKGAASLKKKGAQALILGCTEIPLAIHQKEIDSLPTIDPTNVLARALIKNISLHKLKTLNR